VGSLHEQIKAENLLHFIQGLLVTDNPEEKLKRLSQAVVETFQLTPSKKHMAHQEVVCFKPDFGSFTNYLVQVCIS